MKRLILRVDVGDMPNQKAKAYLKKTGEVVKAWRESYKNEVLIISNNIEVIEVDI